MDTTGAAAHLPVMKERVVALLGPALESDGAVLVDATLGRAGHASALLAQHPEVEARMHAELDQVLGGRTPTAEDVPHLPYTEAVFAEHCAVPAS